MRLARRWPVACAFGLIWHAGALSALAQAPARLPDADKGIFQWLVAAGIGVLIAAPAFLNPKRTHLD